jgi:hypothetical protein
MRLCGVLYHPLCTRLSIRACSAAHGAKFSHLGEIFISSGNAGLDSLAHRNLRGLTPNPLAHPYLHEAAPGVAPTPKVDSTRLDCGAPQSQIQRRYPPYMWEREASSSSPPAPSPREIVQTILHVVVLHACGSRLADLRSPRK